MNGNNRTMNITVTALFIGIILSFSLYFGFTALTDGNVYPENITDGMVMKKFSGAYYDSDVLNAIGKKIDYELLHSLHNSEIIVGKDNFVFDASTAENGYDYLLDYLGENRLHKSELEALANVVLLRKLAYENHNTDYLLVVIPNSQSVYSDNMPDYISGGKKQTRLEQLTEYIDQCGYDFYFDATEHLKSAKAEGTQLYNNTENTLNSYGALTVYEEVSKKLDEMYSVKDDRSFVSKVELYTRSTDGKTLAKKAGISELLKNRTIALSDGYTDGYEISDYYGTMVKTTAQNTENTDVILLEFTDEWDKIVMMPYFSNSYSTVAYKTNHQFSRLITDDLKADVVVQFIREDELYDMIDTTTVVTYNAGLHMNINDVITSQPIVTSRCAIDTRTVCIAGETESGAIITLLSDGKVIAQQRSAGQLFIIAVDMKDSESMEVSLVASVNGKETSAPVTFTINAEKNTKEKKVGVGGGSHLYSTDTSWIPEFTEEQITAVTGNLAESVDKTKTLTGKDTEYVYVIVPDKISVYGDDLNNELTKVSEKINAYKDTVSKVRSNAGMTVLDLTNAMIQSTTLANLYYHTGTKWTGYGAYAGYYELMSYISEKFTSVKVHDLLLDYKAKSESNIGGELIKRLGLDSSVISENYLTITPTYESIARYEYSGGESINIKDAFISFADNDELPTAIIMRDEYGTAMLENMAEHFAKMVVLKENEFKVPDELISEIKPDYIITIRYNGSLT